MGLERMASVMQNVPTNFDTDLFQPIIQATCREAGVTYGENRETDIALKVIADHIRTLVFAVGDGVLPSNEGRGYVLRRLLRRAVRYGRVLGIQRPFLYRLTGVVAEIMRDYYPEPEEKKEFIERVIRGEEERFLETLSEGLNILEEVAERARKEGRSVITGEEAFRLYDTYGFPIDLTEDFAREKGLTVDREGFERAMEDQRERARAARKDVDSMQVQGGVLSELNVEVPLCRIHGDGRSAPGWRRSSGTNSWSEEAGEGQTCTLILEETPFYAESGGQVADKGWIVYCRRPASGWRMCRKDRAGNICTRSGWRREPFAGESGWKRPSTRTGTTSAKTTPPPICCTRR